MSRNNDVSICFSSSFSNPYNFWQSYFLKVFLNEFLIIICPFPATQTSSPHLVVASLPLESRFLSWVWVSELLRKCIIKSGDRRLDTKHSCFHSFNMARWQSCAKSCSMHWAYGCQQFRAGPCPQGLPSTSRKTAKFKAACYRRRQARCRGHIYQVDLTYSGV